IHTEARYTVRSEYTKLTQDFFALIFVNFHKGDSLSIIYLSLQLIAHQRRARRHVNQYLIKLGNVGFFSPLPKKLLDL
ncbi:MAG: hypothetical protein ABL911_12820, partial [Gallionella sp.]